MSHPNHPHNHHPYHHPHQPNDDIIGIVVGGRSTSLDANGLTGPRSEVLEFPLVYLGPDDFES